MMYKKGKIGTTLVWIIATVIITFLMVIFLVLTSLIAGDNKIDPGERVVSVGELYSLLNTNIEIEGESIKIRNSIINSVKKYNEIKNDNGVGLLEDDIGINIFKGDPSEVKIRMETLGYNNENLDMFDELKSLDIKLGRLISDKLKESCEEFYFEIPQGIINNEGLFPVNTQRNVFDKRGRENLFIDVLKSTIEVDGKIFELKYRKLKEC